MVSHPAAHKRLASVSEISHNADCHCARAREREDPRELLFEHSTFDNSRLRLDRATTPVKMKLNISYPANGSQKLIEIDDERKLRAFMEKRMGTEVLGDSLGDEFKGYVSHPLFPSFFCCYTSTPSMSSVVNWRDLCIIRFEVVTFGLKNREKDTNAGKRFVFRHKKVGCGIAYIRRE